MPHGRWRNRILMSEYHFQRLFTRWGVEGKTALIGWEASHCQTVEPDQWHQELDDYIRDH